MSFFERFAKLQSEVEYYGTSVNINVFDDEISDSRAIMWLQASIQYLEDLYHISEDEINNIIENKGYKKQDKVLYVDIVNFDDSLFYKLPQKRQNMIAVVLFKKFLNFYKENFGKDSGYWMPVCADFANYELQEKFKAEVDKGTFPEVSKSLLGETSEEDWGSSYYNKDNRDVGNELLNQLIDNLNKQGVSFTSDNLIENFSLKTFAELYNQETSKMFKDNDALSTFYDTALTICIENGNVIYHLPFKNVTFRKSKYFTFDTSDFVSYRYFSFNNTTASQNVVNAEQNLKIVFDSINISRFDDNSISTIDEIINRAKEEIGVLQTASIKRLKKNNSSK